jgi:hypothetical protein
MAKSAALCLRGFSMKFALYLIAFIVAALTLPFFIPGAGQQEGGDPNSGLPWQISIDAAGKSQVFGLTPGVSTLADLKQRFGSEVEVAIIAEPNELGTLEAYYAQVPLGFVLAKVIATVDTSKQAISEMRERALKAKHMESMTRKITLHPDDLVMADRLHIKALSVIPTVNLDEATIIQRFGEPGERIVISPTRVHLLYPQFGLDVMVDHNGKELLQYVSPHQFASLRDPLLTEQLAEGQKLPR